MVYGTDLNDLFEYLRMKDMVAEFEKAHPDWLDMWVQSRHKNDITKEEYFRLEAEYDEVESYETRTSSINTGYEGALRTVELHRRKHPDWYQEWLANEDRTLP